MKIKPEHYNRIKESINTIPREEIRKHGLEVKESGKFKDFNARMAWDIFWASPISKDREFFNGLYEYLNDEHLNTAIKRIVLDLNIELI